MSLWADYIAELRDTKFIEYEWGFISYSFLPECLFIEDIYVVPEKRKEGLGLRLVEEAEIFGREAGKPFSMACVRLENRNHVESLKAHLAAGFVPFMTENDKIWTRRTISPKETP